MGRSSIKKLEVSADGTGLSSRAGAALLPLAAERLGLTDALAWALAETRERRSAHDPGRVFCDLAVMLADGGRCVSDLIALGSQPALFGDVASVSTARRVLLSVGAGELDRLRTARARARARAWAAGAAPEQVILDFDATPITAHSDKEHAAGHDKGGFGFHPLLATCGRELLAAILRPAMPAPITPRIICGCSSWRSSSSRPGRLRGRSSRARIRPAPVTRSPTRVARRGCALRSVTPSTSGCARRSSRCRSRRGGPRSPLTGSRARARGSPS